MSVFSSLMKPFPRQEPEAITYLSTGARKVCQTAVDMIVHFEKMHRIGPHGLVYPYHDAVGYPTIGVGHLLSRIRWEPLQNFKPITLEEAQYLHHTDLDKFAIGVGKLVKVPVTDNQFGAIVSLSFNIGLSNLQASTLLRTLNRLGALADVGDQFLRWDKAGGVVLRGLTRRRIAERKLFLGYA